MEVLNDAFYFVSDKLIELQAYFLGVAKQVSYIVLLIAISVAALNHALNGTGLKESFVKISKALIFYIIVVFSYPSIVSWITNYTYVLAYSSTYPSMREFVSTTVKFIRDKESRQMELSNNASYWGGGGIGYTYADMVSESDPDVFKDIVLDRNFVSSNRVNLKYTTVAPSAALYSIMLVAGECIKFSDGASWREFSKILKGLFCALIVIFTGIFAVLEYLIAYLEFLFISSVGIIPFPLSLWEGTKFMAEKFIGAMLGFFIKLLFCTICVFLLLWGFMTLAKDFSTYNFIGGADQIVKIAFVSMLFLYICKSAPGLAQSLLTGTPSLSAAGAIGAVTSAVGATVAMASHGFGAGANVLGAGTRGALSGASAVARAAGAASGAHAFLSASGAGRMERGTGTVGAFMGSLGAQSMEAIGDRGSGLMRSIISRPLFSGGPPGGGGGDSVGYNPRAITRQLVNEDYSRKAVTANLRDQYMSGRRQGPTPRQPATARSFPGILL